VVRVGGEQGTLGLKPALKIFGLHLPALSEPMAGDPKPAQAASRMQLSQQPTTQELAATMARLAERAQRAEREGPPPLSALAPPSPVFASSTASADGEETSLRLEDLASVSPLEYAPPPGPVSAEGATAVDDGLCALMSIGSALHALGKCRECKYAWSEQGCANGASCKFCHFRHQGLEKPKGRPCKSKRRTYSRLIARMEETLEKESPQVPKNKNDGQEAEEVMTCTPDSQTAIWTQSSTYCLSDKAVALQVVQRFSF